ncbi:MAG: hypothetical protein U0X20_00655 [Caldilineaceae bacterium]
MAILADSAEKEGDRPAVDAQLAAAWGASCAGRSYCRFFRGRFLRAARPLAVGDARQVPQRLDAEDRLALTGREIEDFQQIVD